MFQADTNLTGQLMHSESTSYGEGMHLDYAGGLLAPVVQLQPVLLHPVRRHRLQPHVRPRCRGYETRVQS